MADMLSDRLSGLSLQEKSAISLESTKHEYILQVTAQSCRKCSCPRLAVTSTNHTAKLYSLQNLAHCTTLKGHTKPLTGIQFANENEDLIYTSSRDGTVRCWDFRISPSETVQCFEGFENTPPVFTAMGLSHNDMCVVAGTEPDGEDVYLLFWDTRMAGGGPVGGYQDSHQDDVTQVKFHPNHLSRLITGSTDGLVCVFDISQETEDDAIQTTFNTGATVNQIGWCGPGYAHVYCTTDMDALHVWNSEGEFEDILSLEREDIRAKTGPEIDYIVDCFQPSQSEDLHMLTGKHSGELELFSVTTDAVVSVAHLDRGHSNTVRGMHWDSESGTLVTGGEDAMLCLWKASRDKGSTQTASGEEVTHTYKDRRKSKATSKVKAKVKKHISSNLL